MARQSTRVSITEDGTVVLVDPDFDSLPLLRSVDPCFRVQRAPLAGFAKPRFVRLRSLGSGIAADQLLLEADASLWKPTAPSGNRRVVPCEASALDVRIELARRALAQCNLCARRCGVDRTRNELGVCGLGADARVAEHFVHIAEEASINPSLVLNLAGCGLRCRYCQQGALLNPALVGGELLTPDLWSSLDARGARSLSLVGGNPDESVYAILRFLAAAPANWHLPIVWNTHAYATPETLRLLDGVVDCYLPDFKYGSEECGRRLSGISEYPATAHAAIAGMLKQGVPVIVRVLVLPGHFDCCHAPALESLAGLPQENLSVSVRGQYTPDWKITPRDGTLARRVTPEETVRVCQRASDLELRLVG